jgi:hypothetical protein
MCCDCTFQDPKVALLAEVGGGDCTLWLAGALKGRGNN